MFGRSLDMSLVQNMALSEIKELCVHVDTCLYIGFMCPSFTLLYTKTYQCTCGYENYVYMGILFLQ